jgi:hypothetical protein
VSLGGGADGSELGVSLGGIADGSEVGVSLVELEG